MTPSPQSESTPAHSSTEFDRVRHSTSSQVRGQWRSAVSHFSKESPDSFLDVPTASVVKVNPGGTGSPIEAISAKLAPLFPSNFFCFPWSSACPSASPAPKSPQLEKQQCSCVLQGAWCDQTRYVNMRCAQGCLKSCLAWKRSVCPNSRP